MSGEPTSTQHSPPVPPMASEHLGLAERFSSFTDYASSTTSFPQTAATSLDVARFHAFTGELAFSVEPAVRLYLDGGSVYHAERDGDPAIASRLIDAGVLDTVQLLRGIVRVGDVEHLGRFFDRDATIDRDAVMVVLEAATDALVQEIANSTISGATATAYRHHPSGIHRWFVAPVEPTGAQRPASGVMQIDRSVVDELPQLGVSTGAGVTIEWAEPDLAETGQAGDEPPHRAAKDVDIQAELDRFDADRADWAATSGGHDPDASHAVPSPVGEFRIVWPDGTHDPSIVIGEEPSSLPAPTGPPSPGFSIEPLQLDQIPAPNAPVPEDVAAAVRRALQALGGESSRSATAPAEDLAPPEMPAPSTPNVTDPSTMDGTPSAPTVPATPMSFAPPTMDMRAEAIYERERAETSHQLSQDVPPVAASTDADIDAATAAPTAPAPSHPDAGAAVQNEAARTDNGAEHPESGSVEADADDVDSVQDRQSALRRLIGSLRNKG